MITTLQIILFIVFLFLLGLLFRRSRHRRRIRWYFALHRNQPAATNEVESWVIHKVAEIWFTPKDAKHLRMGMKFSNIHDIWYKNSIGDALEHAQLVLDTEVAFRFKITEVGQVKTLGDWAKMIQDRRSAGCASWLNHERMQTATRLAGG